LLDEIPLTPHGKPNRAALVALTENARLTGMGGEPVNEVEDVLAGIWAEAFNLEMVGRDDDFFDLGGDSLLAAVVSARINDSLGVTVDMESFNTHSTVAGMGSFVQDSLEKMLALGTGKPATIPKWESLTGPLSYLEERLWAMFKDPKIQQAYNMGAYHEIKGALNVLLFRECINTVLQRHEVFSTAYTQTDAGAQRTIREFCPVEIPLHDLSDDPDAEAAIQATRHALVAVPFDFEHGPLVRMELFKLGPENYRLVRIHSHLISDGWSWKVFFKDLAECYAAAMERREPSLKPLRLQYSDFAAWQRTFMARDGGQFQKQLAWWKDQLSGGAQPVALPFRRDTPISDATPEDGNLTWGIPARTSLALDRLGRVERATYYMTRLAGFAATIGSLTGQTDFVIGSYATNRDRVELQDIFGFFANLVTLRFNYDRTMTFRSWLGRVRTLVTEVHGRADLPYEVLCQELRQGGVEPPEVRVIFSISGRLPPMSVAGLQIMPVKGRSHRMPWGMSLLFHRWTESQDCNCNFDANLYESEGMRALLETYKTMLALVAEFPDVPMHQLHERAHADKGANLNLQKA
ncbi:MAG TPA: condensation domain-containing protein, partial [Verrucomicrobium sp.]|nr:condensation domain-containing protein [Verrucomicrobium sp.]